MPDYIPDLALVELVAEALGTRRNGLASDGRGWFRTAADRVDCYADATAVLAALAAEGRLLPGEVDPDLWQYGWRDPDEGDDVVAFEGRPGIITRRMVRRPLRVVGPWLPAPTTPRFEREDDRG